MNKNIFMMSNRTMEDILEDRKRNIRIKMLIVLPGYTKQCTACRQFTSSFFTGGSRISFFSSSYGKYLKSQNFVRISSGSQIESIHWVGNLFPRYLVSHFNGLASGKTQIKALASYNTPTETSQCRTAFSTTRGPTAKIGLFILQHNIIQDGQGKFEYSQKLCNNEELNPEDEVNENQAKNQ